MDNCFSIRNKNEFSFLTDFIALLGGIKCFNFIYHKFFKKLRIKRSISFWFKKKGYYINVKIIIPL